MNDPPTAAEPLQDRALAAIAQAPLPLAQLIRRSLDGKSAVERHNCAYYLGEATLKLAAALRIRLFLEHAMEPEGKVARRLVCLKLPSLGQWCELLRATNQELASVPGADSLPLVRRARELGRRPARWEGVQRLSDALVEADVLNREIARRAAQGGLQGFFELMTAYRNEVIGHGAQRSDAYCDRFFPLLLDAMLDVLGTESLFDGMRMGRVQSSGPGEPGSRDLGTGKEPWDAESASGGPAPIWQDLSGLQGSPTDHDASGLDPTQLYFRNADRVISIHPLVVVREDDLGREQVGFLNRTLLRTRTIAHGLVEEVRRVDYLDYASGDTFSGIDTQEGMRDLLDRTRSEDRGGQLVAEPVVRGVVVGDFEVIEPLGRGATGVVFSARQRSMGRTVALKVLEPSMVATALQRRRFQREIAVLARCDHPNVVKVLTAGADQGRQFYAMEFVDGADLGRVGRVLAAWRRDGRLLREGHLAAAVRLARRIQKPVGDDETEAEPVAWEAPGRALELRVAELFADAAEGLHHLHERGTVHRDVKPGNLMLTLDASRMVVMDLGSARHVDETATRTQSGAGLAGTLRYMAPEQLDPHRGTVDGRVDVHALGATLFEVLTGQRMFDGDNEGRIVQQVLGGRATSLRAVVPSAPVSLEAVIDRATAKRPADRYATARALAQDLRAVAAERPTLARPRGVVSRAGAVVRQHPAASGFLVLSLTLAVGASGAGVAVWSRSQPRTALFAVCVEHRGAWVGVGEIEESRGRSSSCRVTRRGGRTLRAERVNGLGRPVENEDGDASWEHVYTEDGELLERLHHRADGALRQRHRFVWDGATLHATVVDRSNYRISLDGSEVSTYRVAFDDRGFPKGKSYLNDRGAPRRNVRKVFGESIETDDRGRVTRVSSLDASGQPAPDEDGVTTVTFRYDAGGTLLERVHLDGAGAPVDDRRGVARMVWEADERGNRSTERRFDREGAAVRGPDGCGGWRATYDDAGAVVAWTCLGPDGRPDVHREGYVTRKNVMDEAGRPVEESYFDASGHPVRHRDGCARWRAEYDARGYRVEQRFFDEKGRSCDHRDGYASWRAQHDDAGHLVQVSYFGGGGQPAWHRDGVASWRSTYDDLGNLLSTSYFGVDGGPVLNRYGYARRVFRHDERGDIVELSYEGVDGQLRVSADGYARLDATYDDRGRRVEQRYRDAAGLPVRDTRDLAFGARMSHDDHGRVVVRVMLGESGAPSPSVEGVLEERTDYDAWNRVIRRAYVGEGGKVLGETRVEGRVGVGGLVVAGVYRGEGAESEGLRVGDEVVEVEGQPVVEERDLWMAERREGEVAVVVVRGGKRVGLLVWGRGLRRVIWG